MRSCLIIPCHNEADRLDRKAVEAFVQSTPTIDLMMVDDGSDDATGELLQVLKNTTTDRLHVLCLPSNQGKAKAVRAGVQAALALKRFDVVGFCDADLATPLSEMIRLTEVLDKQGADMVFGCRLLRLGADIRRSKLRHYLGRIFATVVSSVLGLPVYDTQCGAKVFRASIACEIFEAEFSTRWLFDIELLARYLQSYGQEFTLSKVIEVPLKIWIDRPGSKLTLHDFLMAPCELWRIWRRYRTF
nr:glycosyltransferase [Gammaproteobacteria bacterium]